MLNNSKISLETGLDVLVAEEFARLKDLRVAILANQASVDKNLNHVLDLALKFNINIVKIFGPEHGFLGTLQDMEQVDKERDPRAKIPIVSLYGDHKESLKLNAKHLKDVDVLLVDLQDIGSRYYTFHCTIAWAMAACKERDVKLLVIDRPNPINANSIEGNLVKKTNFSFVGAYPLPNRHGFTMGELTLYVRDILQQDLDLEIVWMKAYQRGKYFDKTNLHFVAPSPNMPSVNACVVYPGMCLIEGTNLSEGRGTCTPFEIVGAPYITDPNKFKDTIDSFGFAGVKTRALSFRPMFQKHAQKQCHGVFIHVTDRNKFTPLRFALAVIRAAQQFKGFDWRREPYEFETDRLAIELLLGDKEIVTLLEKGAPLNDIFSMYSSEEVTFSIRRQEYLHYQ